MKLFLSRICREKHIVTKMIRLYCKTKKHSSNIPCSACQELLNYALARLDHCVFGERKPACSKCPIHCYKPDMRERIKEVMRKTGRMMLWHHPLLAFCHLISKLSSCLAERKKISKKHSSPSLR